MAEQGCCGAGHVPATGPGLQDPGPPSFPGVVTRLEIEKALAYVPLVARRYLGCGPGLDELLAAGNLGIVEAALRFDRERGVKFLTYADWWIRKSILESIEEQSGPMRLPRYQHERLRALRAVRAEWIATRGREPGAEELAGAAGIPQHEARRLLQHQNSAVSLDHPVSSGDGRPLKELLAASGFECPQRSLVRRELAQRVRRHLSSLDCRERRVIHLRFGFDLERPRTLREVGLELGISRERVRQVELRALLKLRRRL